MRIESLSVTGYQGLNFLALDFPQPITLISGKNATGKTSVKDAIEFALTGISRRVKLKKNYDQLVRVGSDPKNSQVSLVVDGFTFSRKTASGKAGHEDRDHPEVLPHLLGSSRFALLPHVDQSRLLFSVSGVKRDVKVIKAMMKERGVEDGCIEQSVTMLRAGFAAAVKSCKAEQSRFRGQWEGITGDRFGEAKAVNWVAEATTNKTDIEQSKTAMAELEKAILESVPRLTAVGEQIAALTQSIQHAAAIECPECNARLQFNGGELVKAGEAIDIKAVESERDGLASDRAKGDTAIREMRERVYAIQNELALAADAEDAAKTKTKRAASALHEYSAWKKAAEALAPTGIPLQLLEAGLLPINERLVATCKVTGWKPIVINSDLSITYGGIEYGLCSESEQWRIDAGIAECFSLLSNVKVFVLDRMDVLHPDDRGGLIKWLISVKDQHDSIIILATLKVPPTGMPDCVNAIWLEEGNQVQEKAA